MDANSIQELRIIISSLSERLSSLEANSLQIEPLNPTRPEVPLRIIIQQAQQELFTVYLSRALHKEVPPEDVVVMRSILKT